MEFIAALAVIVLAFLWTVVVPAALIAWATPLTFGPAILLVAAALILVSVAK